jgi:hypothetical protein
MASADLFERHPLERTVRWRTVANELSMTFVTGMRMLGADVRLCSLGGRPMVRPSGTEAPGARRCGQADPVR